MGHFARKDHGRNAAQERRTITTVVFPAAHQPALLFTAQRREEPEKWEQRACKRNGEENSEERTRQPKVSSREKVREEQKEH